VGALNSFVGLGTIFAALYFLRLGAVEANVLGYGIGFVLSFLLNKHWTFRFEGDYLRSLVLFGAVLGISYIVNLGVVLLSWRQLGLSVYLAQIAGLLIYTIVSFLGARYLAFREQRLQA